MKKILHPEVITMLGAIIVFSSWVIQNFIEKKYQMQREGIERVEKIINEYETYATYYSLNSDIPDSANQLLFKKNYLILSINLFNIVAQQLNDSSMSQIASGRLTISDIEKKYIAKQYNRLDSVCVALREIRDKYQSDILIKFYNKYNKICAKEDKSSWVFVIVYGLGAIVSGIGVFLKKTPGINTKNSSKKTVKDN